MLSVPIPLDEDSEAKREMREELTGEKSKQGVKVGIASRRMMDSGSSGGRGLVDCETAAKCMLRACAGKTLSGEGCLRAVKPYFLLGAMEARSGCERTVSRM